MISNSNIENKLKEFHLKGHLVLRTENNPYLKISYKGSDKLVSSKWNVKIYNTGSIVCNDMKLLQDIIDGSIRVPDKQLKVLQIDDAGVGFPLLGVMVGVSDGIIVNTGIIDVVYFQKGFFEKQIYLEKYRDKGLDLVYSVFKASPETHRIEICTGHINTVLKDSLREKGFDVRVTEIKGLLQDCLEDLFRDYVKAILKQDIAYDPKELSEEDIVKNYYRVVNWGKKHVPNLLKTGWKNL